MAVKRKRKPSARSKKRWFVANRKWLTAGAVALVVAIAAGGGYLIGQNGSGGRSAGGSPAKPASTQVAVAPIRPPLPTPAPGQQQGPVPPVPMAAPGQPTAAPPLPNAAPGQQPLPPPVPVPGAPAAAPSEPTGYQDQDRQRLAELARSAQDEPRKPRELASLPPAAAPVVPNKPPPQGRRPMLTLAPGEKPMIAMVFDDVGVVKSRSKRVIDLPGPLNLSFLPYAQDLPAQTADARRHGHEVMLHMPMQPLGKADPGQNALTVDLSHEEIRRRLDWALDRVGAVNGLNNHMGSRFTEQRGGMAVVMSVLQRRNLYFLDSMTIGHSVGVATAQQAGVPVVARDVFLDDKISRENAAKWLATLEVVAKRQGYGVAIGHPHDETVDVVGPWLRTLDAKGLRLVRLEDLVKRLNPPGHEVTPVSQNSRQPW